MNRRVLVLPVAAAAVFAATVGPAAAAWNSSGAGSATARATQLQPPTAARVAVSTAAAHLTWTAPSGGPVPGGYLVTRNGATVCTTTTSTACDDRDLSPGTTYSYLITSTTGRYWVSATPLSMTATTSNGGFALSALTPSTVTAGVELTFTLSATFAYGGVDGTYTGTHKVTITSSIPAGPGGNASGGEVAATFATGVATKVATTVYGSGTQTLTVADGGRTGSLAVTVTPAAVSTLELVDATGAAVVCPPGGHVTIAAGKQLTAKVAAIDAYGNQASASGPLSIALSFPVSGVLTSSSTTIPAGTSVSNSSFSLAMPAGGAKSGKLTISGPGTLSTSCTVN